MDCSTPGFPVHHQSRSLLKFMSVKSVMPSNHLILCPPLLPLPSVFRSIRVFLSESVLHIRWPKYWSSSFSISPSNECSGLISFTIEWFDPLAVQGTLKSTPLPPDLTLLTSFNPFNPSFNPYFPGKNTGVGCLALLQRIFPTQGWNSLQYSCLENFMDRGAWQATVHGVAKGQTRLSD